MGLNGVVCRGDENQRRTKYLYRKSVIPRAPPPEFFKKTFHPSGYMVTNWDIECYRMKDVSGIFQPSFITERDKKF